MVLDGPGYKTKISAVYGVSSVNVMFVVAGVPQWALVLVNTPNHTALLSDPEIFALPDFSLDGRYNDIPNVIRNAVSARATTLSITLPAGGLVTWREVLRAVGKKAQASFDENNFWVG